MEDSFSQALMSREPCAELGVHADVYAWLIGGWTVKAVDYFSDGTKQETSGEWYFAWVLEGRAVQDVWIAPQRSLRNDQTSKIRNRYGSTIRMFDFETNTWTIHWFNPVSGAKDMLVAEVIGTDVVQHGKDSDGNLMRWLFTDITSESFRWYGERSMTGGTIWIKEAEFFGTRMK